MMRDINKQIPHAVIRVMKRIHHAGFAVYIVGGFIRDVLLKKDAKDIDLVTDATSADLKGLFGKKSRLIGRRFPIVHVDIGPGDVVEISSLPQLGFTKKLSLTYRREKILDQMITEDSKRRDFTINAMYLSYPDYRLIDKLNGRGAIGNKLIKIIGDPKGRMHEDPVRILRAIRLEAKFGFKQHKKFEQWVSEFKPSLFKISHQRMFLEFIKMMHTGHALSSVTHLFKYHLMDLFIKHRGMKREYICAIAQHCDDCYEQGRYQSTSFLMAALLWPQVYASIGRRDKDKESHKKEDLFSYLSRISHKSSQLNLPRRLQEFMISIWLVALLDDSSALDEAKVQMLPGYTHAKLLKEIWQSHQ